VERVVEIEDLAVEWLERIVLLDRFGRGRASGKPNANGQDRHQTDIAHGKPQNSPGPAAFGNNTPPFPNPSTGTRRGFCAQMAGSRESLHPRADLPRHEFDAAITQFFALALLPGRDREQAVQNLGALFLDRRIAARDRAAIDVDVVLHALVD